MQITLTDRQQPAQGTLALWFKPERPVPFTAGQFGSFTLPDLPAAHAKDATRTFSFAASPNNDALMIATRTTGSAFKKGLAAAPLGTRLQMIGPTGLFTLHADAAHPAVFLTGGIGITPVRSIAEYATQERLPHRILVLYSNRTRAQAPFIPDFRAWERRNGNLRLVVTLTDERPADPNDIQGTIDETMLQRHVPDLASPVFYVVGPPGMVTAMKGMLERLGIEPARVKAEDFTGY